MPSGARLQALARKLLESEGYRVHSSVRSAARRGARWVSLQTDIFGAFDLVATRLTGPRPLRFIQITTATNVSGHIEKVDSVPLKSGVASAEIWAWHGGQRRLDRRYRREKVWLPRNYFQVYFKERAWKPHPKDRVFAKGETRTKAE